MKKEFHSHRRCRFCGEPVDKDTAALNKKLVNRSMPTDSMVCIQCMAETLGCEAEDLRDKIEEYKSEGCILFG